jgi:hypothetical protein
MNVNDFATAIRRTDAFFDLIRKIPDNQNDAIDLIRKHVQRPLQTRTTRDGNEGLGDRVCDGPESGSEAGAHDDRVHS